MYPFFTFHFVFYNVEDENVNGQADVHGPQIKVFLFPKTAALVGSYSISVPPMFTHGRAQACQKQSFLRAQHAPLVLHKRTREARPPS